MELKQTRGALKISVTATMAKKKRATRQHQEQKHLPLQRAMKKLVQMSGKKRKIALQHANNVFIRQLASAVKGVRQKPLSSQVRAKLARHRSALRSLANPQTSLQSKRKVIVRQKGGFFGAILASLAAPLIGSVLRGLTGGK